LYAEIKNEIILPRNIEFVLTPHFNEASKILSKNITEIKADRLKTAIELVKVSGLNVLLKGPYSIVTDGTNININSTGNPLLATAGSGDVLSGMIGALSLKDMSLFTAATLAVYLHGLSADLHKHNKGITLKASDIIDNIVKSIEYIKI
jgi:NAD(P)H-hydrate epimerase